jgi:membrane protein YqaA with SNARE-associated domain
MVAFRYIDVILALIALPVLLALGAPALGSALGVGVWVGQRLLQIVDRRWFAAALEPRKAVAASLFERFGRIWLLVAAIVIAAVVGGRRDGLTAAIVIFGAYSIAFAVTLTSGQPAPRDQDRR